LNGLPLRCEFERTRAKPPNSWEAYDCYLQASDPFTAFDTSLKHDASLIEIERAVALNPNYMNWQFGAALILAGHSLRKHCRPCAIVSRAPDLRTGHIGSAVTYAQLGQMERARVGAAEVLRVQRNYTTPGTARRLAEFKDDKHCFDDLRKAGCLSRCT
jgi:hypothetical protein